MSDFKKDGTYPLDKVKVLDHLLQKDIYWSLSSDSSTDQISKKYDKLKGKRLLKNKRKREKKINIPTSIGVWYEYLVIKEFLLCKILKKCWWQNQQIKEGYNSSPKTFRAGSNTMIHNDNFSETVNFSDQSEEEDEKRLTLLSIMPQVSLEKNQNLKEKNLVVVLFEKQFYMGMIHETKMKLRKDQQWTIRKRRVSICVDFWRRMCMYTIGKMWE